MSSLALSSVSSNCQEKIRHLRTYSKALSRPYSVNDLPFYSTINFVKELFISFEALNLYFHTMEV